jgi:hypothetical protein
MDTVMTAAGALIEIAPYGTKSTFASPESYPFGLASNLPFVFCFPPAPLVCYRPLQCRR